MSRYRKVDPRLWADERVRRLSRPLPNGRDLWIYLLTARESTSIPGVIPTGVGAIADALYWPVEGVKQAFAEIEREGMAKADWEAGLVWIPKALRYNEPENPNVVKGWASVWAEVPECPLKQRAHTLLLTYCESRGPEFHKAFVDGCKVSRTVTEMVWERVTETVPETVSPGLPTGLPKSGTGTGTGTGEKHKSSSADADHDPPPPVPLVHPEKLQALWNELADPCLPRWAKLTKARRALTALRLREQPDLGTWREVIEKINASRFCLGENDRGWRASPDWLLKPDTATKALEGKYDQGRGLPTKGRASERDKDWSTAKVKSVMGPHGYRELVP